jgi:hypothetical protein
MAHEWFVINNGKETGPYTAQQLREMATTGKVTQEALVRRNDMQAPRKASTIKGLFGTVEVAPARSSRPSEVEAAPSNQKETPSKKPLIIASIVGGAFMLLCGGTCGLMGLLGHKAGEQHKKDEAQKAGLTADFMPCIAGNVKHYEETRYDAESGEVLPVSSTVTETCLNDNIIKMEWTTTSPGQPPTTGKGEAKLEVKDGLLERELGNVVIKLGAKPNDEWPDPRVKGTYKLVRFEEAEGKDKNGESIKLVRAVIEARYPPMNSREMITEYVLARGDGIQSVKDYMVVQGRKVLTRHKRLISSTSQPANDAEGGKGNTIADFITRMRQFSRQDWPTIGWLTFDPAAGRATTLARSEAEFFKRFGKPIENVVDKKKADISAQPKNDSYRERFRLWTYRCTDGTITLHVEPTHIQPPSGQGDLLEVLDINIGPGDCVKN